MKSSSTQIILAAKLLILSLLVSTSCVRDNIEPPAPIDKTAKITFALKLPDNNIPSTSTRALDKPAEEKVDDVTIIAFKDDKLYFQAQPKAAIVNNVFTVELVKGEYEIMVLANVKEEVSNLKLNKEEPKASVEERLKYVLSTTNHKWIADPDETGYHSIPMSSIIRAVKIEENSSFKGTDAFTLHRILAKINVNIINEDPLHTFKLTSVHLYNYNLKGYITPKFNADKTVLNIPTQTKQLGPIEYTLTEPSLIYTNEIYLLEAQNSDTSQDPAVPLATQTCIVIGGTYNGSARTYYYRVDFNYKDTDDKLQYIDLLRNHRYEVNINKIDMEGADSAHEAYTAGAVNVDSEIIVWNDSEIIYVKSDGRLSLGVNKESVTVPTADNTDNELLVMSNYKETPTLKVSSSSTDADAGGVGWISKARLEKVSTTGSMSRYTLYYDTAENSVGPKRTAYIHISAGTLDMVITVNQEYIIYLKITKKVGETWEEVSELTFAQDSKDLAPAIQTYRIEWLPKAARVSLSLTATGGVYEEITWPIGTGPLSKSAEISSPQGQVEFNVQPNKIANYQAGSFTEAKTTLNVSVVSKGLAKTLVFHQYAKEVYIVAPTSLPLDGKSTHYVTVKSNVDWELYANKNKSSGIGLANVRVVQSVGTGLDLQVMDNAGNAKTVKVSGGKSNLPNGTQVSITTIDDIFTRNDIYQGSLGLYAESTQNAEMNDAKSILCVSGIKQDRREANCYVLNPTSGIGLLIPVRAANGNMTDCYKTNGAEGNELYNKDNAGKEIIVSGKITNAGANSTYGAKLVWADEAGGKGKGLADDGLLSHVLPVVNGEYGYIIVLPGHVKKEGNAVVAVTRNTDGTGEILWSWHIWVTTGVKFEGGKNMKTRIMPGHDGAGPLTAYWLDRNLGALNNGGAGKTDMYTYGLHYQWGRKDPFPNINKTVALVKGEENERQLYDADGPLPMNGLHGCVIFNDEGGTTVQESVQTPLTFYYFVEKTGLVISWLSDYIGTLWGVTFGGDYDTDERGKDLGKSIFDPCPAGYRIPVRISESWASPTNTKHWGNEIQDIGGAVLLQNLKTEHGFQWPASALSYKGGWYPSASVRYVEGLNTVGGNESNGQYWSSNSVFYINYYRGRILNFAETPKKIIPSSQILPYAGASARCVAY